MVVVVAVVVVGVTVVPIIVLVGPDGASSLYARPFVLVCMSCLALASCLHVLPSPLTHTHKRSALQIGHTVHTDEAHFNSNHTLFYQHLSIILKCIPGTRPRYQKTFL